jgi:SAM-dependent methyltransferase
MTRIPFPACPLCNSTSFAPHARGDCARHPLYVADIAAEIVWMRCSGCDHIFTEGYFSPETAATIFKATNDHQQVGYNLENGRKIAARMIERVLPYASSGVWLDVGFGNGALLFTAQEFGFTPLGLDLRQQNVDTVRKLGIEAYAQDLGTLALTQPCAVISMADVLEHIPYPKETLAAAHRLLGPDGVLFLSMPNADTMLWRSWDAIGSNPYWNELEHYHNFGRARLYGLLRENGFAPVRYSVSERYRAGMEVIAVRR